MSVHAPGVAPFHPAHPLAVCDITEYYGETSGGVRTYLGEKSRYIEARPGSRQIVIVPGPADTFVPVGSVRRYEVGAPLIPGQAPYRAMLAPGRVRRILESERPDLIELGSSHAVPWLVRGTARRLDIPVVWFLHGHLARIIAPRLEKDRPHRWLAARAAIRYVRAIAAGVERTLVASDFVRNDLERFGVERIVRVPLGVDTGTFHPSRRDRAEATRRRLGLTGPFAMYAGRLTAEKELDTAVDGWRRLRRDDVTLLLVGAGPQEARLRARAGRTVRVVPFIHDRDLLADLHAAAELYLAPGPVETFGLAAHEAMASGTPVLSVDAGAVAEQVRRSGTGALYEPGDAASLAAAADRLLDGDLAPMRAAARRFVEAHHRWDAAFERIFAAYAEVLG